MYIKKFVKFKFNTTNYDLLCLPQILDIGYIASFYSYGFRDLKRHGILNSVKKIEDFFQNNVIFDFTVGNIIIDNTSNLVYFIESYYDYQNKPTTTYIEELLTDGKWIQLCKMGFFEYTIMKKDNFINILLTLNHLLDEKKPFILLYLDDQDWYEVLPFDSQEAMEKFVADHTKIEDPK